MSESINPYQSPDEHSKPSTSSQDTNQQNPSLGCAYQTAAGLGKLVRITFWLLLASEFIQLGLLGAIVYLLQHDPQPQLLNAIGTADAAASIILLVIYVNAIIFYLRWKHRSYSNLPTLSGAEPDTTPGWAIGYYFIPVMNLYWPYRAMREVYNLSARERSRDSAGLVVAWWSAYLLMSLTDRLSLSASSQLETIEDFEVALGADAFGFAASLVATVLVVTLVKAVDARQLETAISLGLVPEQQ